MRQEDLARLIGKSPTMVSFYESGKEDVPEDVLKILVKALKVDPDEVKFFSERLEEDPVPYRTRSIPVEIISDEMLQLARRDFAKRLDEASGREFEMLHVAVGEIAAEQQRRAQKPDEVILHERRKPGANSERVAQLAASSKAALVKIGVLPAAAAGGKGSHSPPSEVDEPSDQTHPRPPASSGESKAPPHGHGGKGQR